MLPSGLPFNPAENPRMFKAQSLILDILSERDVITFIDLLAILREKATLRPASCLTLIRALEKVSRLSVSRDGWTVYSLKEF